MDHVKYIETIESLQKFKDKFMYLQLLNIIKDIGQSTEIEAFKTTLRGYYREVLKTPNPISLRDGSIINEKARLKLNKIMIDMIDLLNDYYGNFKTLPKTKL